MRQPRKTLLIFCEGEKTEPEYLDALKRLPVVRDVAAVELRVDTKNRRLPPLALVATAAEARSKATEEKAEIDEVWCLFDVESPRNHPHLVSAIEQAREAEVLLAVSNPCFELWLILHLRDQGGWLDSAPAVTLRHQLDGSRGKEVDAGLYMPLIATAAGRAYRLEDVHRRDGALFPKDNPSSGMHRLISSVCPPGDEGHGVPDQHRPSQRRGPEPR